jgi:hypothetical protein
MKNSGLDILFCLQKEINCTRNKSISKKSAEILRRKYTVHVKCTSHSGQCHYNNAIIWTKEDEMQRNYTSKYPRSLRSDFVLPHADCLSKIIFLNAHNTLDPLD